MASDDPVDRLLLRLYAAAAQPDGWGQVLEEFGDLLGGCAIGMSLQSATAPPRYFAKARFDPHYAKLLVEEFGTPKDNFMVSSIANLPGGGVIARGGISGHEGYFSSALYNEVFEPQGLAHAAIACAGRTSDHYLPMGIFRRAGQEDFSAEQLALLSRLLPHVCTAVEITRRIEGFEQRQRQFDDFLERLAFGVVFVDPAGAVKHMNRKAEAMMMTTPGLRVRRGRLVGETTTQTSRLRGLVAAALSPSAGAAPPALAIARANGRPLMALAMPLGETAGLSGLFGRGAAITLTDPDQRDAASVSDIAEVLGLTPAQAGLAALLARGWSMEQCSQELGISIHTGRTHLRQIFLRTGVTRQSELVKLVLDAAPPQTRGVDLAK